MADFGLCNDLFSLVGKEVGKVREKLTLEYWIQQAEKQRGVMWWQPRAIHPVGRELPFPAFEGQKVVRYNARLVIFPRAKWNDENIRQFRVPDLKATIRDFSSDSVSKKKADLRQYIDEKVARRKVGPFYTRAVETFYTGKKRVGPREVRGSDAWLFHENEPDIGLYEHGHGHASYYGWDAPRMWAPAGVRDLPRV
jgi:hypothetical protein